MSFRKSIRHSFKLIFAFVSIIVLFLAVLAVDLQMDPSAKCVYHGGETPQRQALVTFGCSDQPQSAEQWQEDLRVIGKYVVYDSSFASIIFTNAMSEFAASASDTTRTEFLNEVHLYARILALAAQTAERSAEFKQNIGLKSKLWAMQFRLAQYIIDGPLTWTFPHDSGDFGLWQRFYIATIRMPASAFAEMCENFEAYRGACTDPDGTLAAYIEQYVNTGPNESRCDINLISRRWSDVRSDF